jgi:ABC-type multidrug transport system permease subunit
VDDWIAFIVMAVLFCIGMPFVASMKRRWWKDGMFWWTFALAVVLVGSLGFAKWLGW